LGKLFVRKSLTSGPHLSDAARRAGPVWQRATAAWPPRAALTPRHKAAVGTAHRASQKPPRSRRSPPTVASPAPPASRPPRTRRRRPDRSPRSRRRPDPRGLKPPTLGPSSSRVARRSPVTVTPRRRLHAGEPPFPVISRASASCRRRATCRRHASAAHAAPAPHTRAVPHVALGRAALCIWAVRDFGPVAPG
jgi:hypothetical protein